MNTKISPLSHTSQSFASFVQQTLGKGYQHALILYQEWYRTGTITGTDPAFNNAKNLYLDIAALMDVSMPTPLAEKLDGQTGKFLVKTEDQLEIESVLIPMQAGQTLCVSSQVGCKMGCSFCETGRMGLLRSLTAQEIVSQVFIARFHLKAAVRNIVFMGMGEPFDNYDHVMQAVQVLCDPLGFGFGPNHITVSTSGCVEGIYRLLEEKGAMPNLAVSLNAPNDAQRNKLMPINRRHDMSALYTAMKTYCSQTGKQILVAYVLIKDRNDALEQAEELAEYLKGLNVKINLIPYNPQSCDRYAAPEQEAIERFTACLQGRGYYTRLRQTKGQKIMAACGQLGNLQLKRGARR